MMMLINTQIEDHSVKSNVVRNRIVQLVGNLLHIEPFTHSYHNGWDSIGYNINSMDIHANLAKLISTP